MLRRPTALFALTLVLLFVSVPTAGQTMSTRSNFMGLDSGRPAITATDIEVFVRVLDLSADERDVLDSMYLEYRIGIEQDYGDVRDEVQDIIEEAMLRNDREMSRDALPLVRAWRQEKEDREQTFLEELTLLLTEEQQSRWPIVERELRRIKDLNGVLSGEGIDIIKLAHTHLGMPVIESAGLSAMLDRYSTTLDARLKDRDAYYEDHAEDFQELRTEDPERAIELWQRMRAKRAALRDLNTETVRMLSARIRSATPEHAGKADAFERAWIDAVLSFRAEPTSAQRQLDRARTLEAISDTQRASLQALKEQSDHERYAIFQDLAKAVFDLETQRPPDIADIGHARSNDEDFTGYEPGSRMHRISERRVELDRRVLRELRNVLTKEQRRAARSQNTVFAQFSKDMSWTSF